jgi:macrolide transport system ATP-binding/permease protein
MSCGSRKLFSLERLAIYQGDKVAVVGANGAGKTTLLRLIARELQPDEGRITVRGLIGVIPQLGSPKNAAEGARAAERMGFKLSGTHSGGERTCALIAAAFAQQPDLLLADEPTTNLDLDGIERLERMLRAFQGGLLLISHDRMLLENVCSKVLDLDGGVFTLYHCGLSGYFEQKEREKAAHQARYEAYAAERDRLGKVAVNKARQSADVKKAPKRMGNSEARLHKMGGQKQKEKLDRAAKAARNRIEHMEKVEKPWRQRPIVFDIMPGAVHSPVLVSANGVSKAYGEHVILDDCRFVIPNGQKTALIGPNGAGKTTLLSMIAGREQGIEVCAGLKIGYYRQDTGGLDDNASILSNAMAQAVYDETFVRTILARLLFRRDEIHNKAGVLSGGERLKLTLAGILLSGFNLLLLDEPTNFLDIPSRQALTDVLSAYPGTVLFASHDRAFIAAVSDRIIRIEAGKTLAFEDGYDAYLASFHP